MFRCFRKHYREIVILSLWKMYDLARKIMQLFSIWNDVAQLNITLVYSWLPLDFCIYFLTFQGRTQSFFSIEKIPKSLWTVESLLQGLGESLQLSIIFYLLLIISEANLHYSTFVNIKFHLAHVSPFKEQIWSILECTRCKLEHHYLIMPSS